MQVMGINYVDLTVQLYTIAFRTKVRDCDRPYPSIPG